VGTVILALDKRITRLAIGLRLISGVLLGVSVLFAFCEVCTRYLLGFSTAWIAESSKYLVLWGAFLLVGPSVYSQSHIRFDFIRSKFGKTGLECFLSVAELLVSFGVAYSSFGMLHHSLTKVSVSEAGTFPVWLLYAILTISMVLLVFFCLHNVLRTFRAVRIRQTRIETEKDD
jgi:TRAP-type C4-dicarboxylate transport system permease small subunit